MVESEEVLEGYVVDLACLRKYTRDELLDRAREHMQKCALMGHCMESGYGLVDEEGGLSVLDSEATLQVADVIRDCGQEKGIRLRVVRERKDGEMHTVDVQLTERPNAQTAPQKMEQTAGESAREERWRHWREEICSRLPQLKQSAEWDCPTDLAAVVEGIFADKSFPESERQVRAEQEVFSFYKREASQEIAPAIEQCLAEAARLQVQDAFERWKIEASVG